MRAGLELETHVALQTRVGIATGLVVVGDLIGSGASQEQAIVGETPNADGRFCSCAAKERGVFSIFNIPRKRSMADEQRSKPFHPFLEWLAAA